MRAPRWLWETCPAYGRLADLRPRSLLAFRVVPTSRDTGRCLSCARSSHETMKSSPRSRGRALQSRRGCPLLRWRRRPLEALPSKCFSSAMRTIGPLAGGRQPSAALATDTALPTPCEGVAPPRSRWHGRRPLPRRWHPAEPPHSERHPCDQPLRQRQTKPAVSVSHPRGRQC
eukprot:4616892-Alexandrium_andersonii.AAC.1